MFDHRPVAERRGHFVAVAAEIERQGKGAAHVAQPVDQPLGDLPLQEVVPLPVAGGTLAAATQKGPVEHQQGIEARHSGYVRAKSGRR